MDEIRIGVVIVAGGSGTRMGGTIPKQFAIVGGEPILVRTINNFAHAFPTAKIIVVLPAAQMDFWRNLSARFKVARHSTVEGGAERFHSVKNGIGALSDAVDLIAIQDGVRPFASVEMIRRTAECAAENGTAIPAVKPVDSFRTITGGSGESESIDRSTLRIIQTPQIFRADLLRAAYDVDYDPAFTDDASVAERAGYGITLCVGERSNIKITTREDMIYASAIAEAMRDNENSL